MRGSPIRTSSDQRSVGSSPRLIAASYVLHRLLVPRHPPCALKNLATQKSHPSTPGRTSMSGPTQTPSYRVRRCSRPLCSSQRTTSRSPAAPPAPRPPTGGAAVREQESPDRVHGCPLPQDPTACLRTGSRHPDSGPRTPRGMRSTGSPPREPAELVSVPPSSSVTDTVGPSRMRNRPSPGTALDHQHEAGGQCSLERR